MPRSLAWSVPLLVFLACGPKKPPQPATITGWHQEEGWAAACYYPPAFDALPEVERRTARTVALRNVMGQWQGKQDTVVHFDDDLVTRVETVLLGEPTKIEAVVVDNLERCQSAMAAGGDTGPWGKWLSKLPVSLTEGQCKSAPLDYTMFDYLDIGRGWQIKASVCKGDHVRIRASGLDYYRIQDKGPWINVAGDPDQRAIGTELPCNTEGCFRGQLILRFTSTEGVESILPVGLERDWHAPDHGIIEVEINDDTWFDNVYKVEGSVEHHTSIEYKGDW